MEERLPVDFQFQTHFKYKISLRIFCHAYVEGDFFLSGVVGEEKQMGTNPSAGHSSCEYDQAHCA